jgi:hypothetical protein
MKASSLGVSAVTLAVSASVKGESVVSLLGSW